MPVNGEDRYTRARKSGRGLKTGHEGSDGQVDVAGHDFLRFFPEAFVPVATEIAVSSLSDGGGQKASAGVSRTTRSPSSGASFSNVEREIPTISFMNRDRAETSTPVLRASSWIGSPLSRMASRTTSDAEFGLGDRQRPEASEGGSVAVHGT